MLGCCQVCRHSSTNIQTAGIIVIGDEVLKGQVQDTNSHFICKNLHSYGVKVVRVSVIGDGIDEIASEVKKFSNRYNYVFTSGGIGPTHDDMTYLGVAKAFGESLQLHPDMNSMVDKWLANKGYEPDVLRKMAELPASAKLVFDPNLPPHSSFPIVNVKNVYVFPGIPQFLEKMFSRMKNIIRDSSDGFQTEFHCRVVYVAKDELSITPQINKAVKKFKGVTFGSYPVINNLYYRTRITMESLVPEHVQEAKEYLSGLMPENTVVNFDSDPVSTAGNKVYDLAANSEHELHTVLDKSLKLIEEAFEKYGIEGVCVCFNGGKDCTALLHMVHAVAQKKGLLAKNTPLQCLYIKGDNPFPEMEVFINEASENYKLKMLTYNGPIKTGLQSALADHPELKGVFMGTRRSDPSGENLNYFQLTDAGWPQITRISPLLDWSFSEIWSFLRTLTLPYCPLYDRGYTSIGNRSNTRPNPALAIDTNSGEPKYRPAYTLNDPHAERTGRQ